MFLYVCAEVPFLFSYLQVLIKSIPKTKEMVKQDNAMAREMRAIGGIHALEKKRTPPAAGGSGAAASEAAKKEEEARCGRRLKMSRTLRRSRRWPPSKQRSG